MGTSTVHEDVQGVNSMIIIPELKKVVLCPPKTASTSLVAAVKKAHPKAFIPYRHGEAGMIPIGYDTWAKVGLVRDPVDRLYSLYCYLRDFDHPNCSIHSHRMRGSVHGVTFSDWVLNNKDIFSYGFTGASIPSPYYLTSMAMPENRKPQTLTLRPDLGTKVWLFEDLTSFAESLGVELPSKTPTTAPRIRAAARRTVAFYFKPDYDLIAELTA